MKNLTFALFITFLFTFLSCVPRKSQCPAFYAYGPGKGVYSVQDGIKAGEELSSDDIKKQNKKILDEQSYYIRVKRNKKTGLVSTSRRVKKGKKGKRTTYTDKGFNFQMGNPVGVDIYNKPALKEDQLGTYKTKD